MVDAADHEKVEQSKSELLSLLEKPQLASIPVSTVFSVFHFLQNTTLRSSKNVNINYL